MEKLLDVVFGEYLPNQMVAFARDGASAEIPLLADRSPLDGHAAAYGCRNSICQLPVTGADGLTKLLKS